MKKCGLILIMMALMTTITSAQQLWDPDGVTPFETFAAVKEKIQAFSYQKIDNKKLEEAAISGMLKSLNDPYCRFKRR